MALTKNVEVEKRGRVGWILINNKQAVTEIGLKDPSAIVPNSSWADALDELRHDPAIHVIVITGKDDGEFYRILTAEHYAESPDNRARLNPLAGKTNWSEGSAPSAIQMLALIEKPVIARLNGDAIGAGQALLWGCDLIIAREDAVVADMHSGMGEVIDSSGTARGFPWAVTPGDGVMAFLPLYLTPTKIKEYLFLSRTWTARQLYEMNVINIAVPAEQLDGEVDRVVEQLLRRPPSVLAHIKRVLNKQMIEQWNLTQDLSAAYQKMDFYQHALSGDMD